MWHIRINTMFHVWSEKKFIEKTKITVIPVSNLHISQCSVGSWVIDRTKLFIVITKVHRTQKFLSDDFCKKTSILFGRLLFFYKYGESRGRDQLGSGDSIQIIQVEELCSCYFVKSITKSPPDTMTQISSRKGIVKIFR